MGPLIQSKSPHVAALDIAVSCLHSLTALVIRRGRLMLASIWSNLPQVWSTPARFGRSQPRCGRIQPTSGRHRPELGRKHSECGVDAGPGLAEVWPASFSRFGAKLECDWASVAPHRPNLGQSCHLQLLEYFTTCCIPSIRMDLVGLKRQSTLCRPLAALCRSPRMFSGCKSSFFSIGHTSFELDGTRRNPRQIWARSNSGRTRPCFFSEDGPEVGQICTKSISTDHVWADADRSKAGIDQIRAPSGRERPTLLQTWPTLVRNRQKMHRVRQSLRRSRPDLAGIRPSRRSYAASSTLFWATRGGATLTTPGH